MVSKSANYCFASQSGSRGLLLLCDVGLGNMSEKLQADFYAGNLPAGKHRSGWRQPRNMRAVLIRWRLASAPRAWARPSRTQARWRSYQAACACRWAGPRSLT